MTRVIWAQDEYNKGNNLPAGLEGGEKQTATWNKGQTKFTNVTLARISAERKGKHISPATEWKKGQQVPHEPHYTWDSKQEEILRRSFPTDSKQVVMELLPSHGWVGIQQYAAKLGVLRVCRSYSDILEDRPRLLLKEYEKAWIAGALDFEGTIGISRMGTASDFGRGFRFRPYLSVVNTNMLLLQEIKRILRLKTIVDRTSTSHKNLRCKPAYMVRTHAMPMIYSTLETVSPYLIAKRKQAQIVMEFIEIQNVRHRQMRLGEATVYTERQLAIVEEMHLLNRRGR